MFVFIRLYGILFTILVAGVIRNQGGGADLFTANIGSFRFHGPSSPRCFYVIDSRRILMKHVCRDYCVRNLPLVNRECFFRDESFDRIASIDVYYLDIYIYIDRTRQPGIKDIKDFRKFEKNSLSLLSIGSVEEMDIVFWWPIILPV